MKKMTQKLLFSLALSVAAMPAVAQSATPTNFTPVPVGEAAPLRFFANLQGSTLFSSNAKDGKFNMYNGQLNLGLIYNVGMGLDVGFGIHGGMFSPYGWFRDASTGLDVINKAAGTDLKQYGLMFGADIMVRYLAMFSDMFYGGVQAQVGYNYTNLLPGSPDSLYTVNSRGSVNSFIPVLAGIVVGMDFKDAVAFYLFPAVELGQTGNYTNTKTPDAADINKGVWKSAVGMQIAVGTAIDLGATKLVIEVKPRMANFSNSNSWGMDATLGAFWDF